MSAQDDLQKAAHVYVVKPLAVAKQDIEQLRVAVEHRTTIGQAQGMTTPGPSEIVPSETGADS